MSTNDGSTLIVDAIRVTRAAPQFDAAQIDGFCFAPPSEFTTVPVTNITYSQGVVAGASSTNISTAKMVNASVNATAIQHLDLTDLLCRTTANKGVGVTAIRLFYTLTGQVLTASPSVAVATQVFPAPSATAGAPTTGTPAGTITPNPATTPVAVPTAGQFYTVDFTFANTVWLNDGKTRVYAEVAFPMTVGGTAHLAGGVVFFNQAPF